MAATPISAPEKCPFFFQNFKNSVSWYQGQNRLTVEATTACGSNHGESYELQNVTLTIHSGSTMLTQLHAATGAYYTLSNRILIDDTRLAVGPFPQNHACLQEIPFLSVDLKTGQLRSPGLSLNLNNSLSLDCSGLSKRRVI